MKRNNNFKQFLRVFIIILLIFIIYYLFLKSPYHPRQPENLGGIETLTERKKIIFNKIEGLKQKDTSIIIQNKEKIEDLKTFKTVDYKHLYDSLLSTITLTVKQDSETLICFDSCQLFDLTVRLYEGERDKALLCNCNNKAMLLDSLVNLQDSTMSVMWNNNKAELKRIKKQRNLVIVAAILELIVILVK